MRRQDAGARLGARGGYAAYVHLMAVTVVPGDANKLVLDALGADVHPQVAAILLAQPDRVATARNGLLLLYVVEDIAEDFTVRRDLIGMEESIDGLPDELLRLPTQQLLASRRRVQVGTLGRRVVNADHLCRRGDDQVCVRSRRGSQVGVFGSGGEGRGGGTSGGRCVGTGANICIGGSRRHSIG